MQSGGNKTPISARFMTGFDRQFAPSSAMFTPGTPPIVPSPQPVRRFDFAAGTNLNWTPRGYDSFGFPALRAFANVELVRLAIETRKDQIERLDWMVKPKKGRNRRTDADERIRKVEKLLRKPDGVTPFASWFRPLVEDLLAIDAPAIERRRDRGGNLIGLDVVDGATIKVLVDSNGHRPRLPAPAFQQVIKGNIWANLTADDLIYAPRNMRSNHLYGFSPVEQLIVTINTVMRRQTQQLAYFTEGNLPQGIINSPDGWTPDQVRDWQDWFDSRLAGNQAERSKLMWTPNGAKYQPFKESPIKDEFDTWLARIVCFAFSLPPTPFIEQHTRATSQEDQDRAMEEGLLPLLSWAKRLFDGVIQDDLGFYDLEFAWDAIADLDPSKQAAIHDINIKNGSLSINEARDQQGLDPIPGGEEPMVYVATGPVPLSLIKDNAERAAAMQQKMIEAPTPDPGAGEAKPAKKKAKAKKETANA